MSKTTYFTTGAIATVLVLLLDALTGQSFFQGPIAMIYVGFLLCLVVLYFVPNGRSTTRHQQSPRLRKRALPRR